MSDQSPQKQLFLVVEWVIKPDRVDEWLEAEYEAWKAVHAMPECLYFEILRDPERPNRFRFLEAWSKDREWFDNVLVKTDIYATLAAKTLGADITEEPLKIEYYERFGNHISEKLGNEVNGSIFRKGYLDGGKLMD